MDFSIVPKRIEEVLENAELGEPFYCVEMGYEPGYIYSIAFGDTSPTLDFLEKFSKLMNVDIMYLLGLVEYIEIEF